VVVMAVPSVKLHAEGNLEDDTSIISPRMQEGGMLAVDAGLAYLLNRYAQAPGADANALKQMRSDLASASANLKKYSADAEKALQKVQALGRQYDLQSDVEMDGRRYGQGSKAWRRTGGHGEYTGKLAKPFDATKVVTNADMSEAEKVAAQLVAKREQAMKMISELPDDITKAEKLESAAGKFKILRIVGNVAIALDAAGHAWAFYDNSRTPYFSGHLKLAQESHDAIFGKIQERVTPPAPRVPMTEAQIEKLPTRGTLVPSGNVPGNEATHESGKPRNRRPPLLDKAPDLNAPIAPLDRPRLP